MAEKCKSCPKSEKCDHKRMELCALADLPPQNLASATQGILIDNMSPVLREEIKSPLSGKVIALSEIDDPVFSGGAMGNGIAIEPTDNKVYAWCLESWWKNDIVQNSIVYLLSLIVMAHKEIQKY